MRRLVLGLLVVSGLSFGCTPPAPAPVQPPPPAGAPAPTTGSTSAGMSMDTSAKLVSIKVPDMHCPYGCYPKVKETLETVAGVKKVDLAPQKAGDSIDNPIVNIQLSGAFDSAAAVKALEANGWKSEVVN